MLTLILFCQFVFSKSFNCSLPSLCRFKVPAAWLLALWLCGVSIVEAQIYVAYSSEGVPLFSNQPIGRNSKLFLHESTATFGTERKSLSRRQRQRQDEMIPIIRQVADNHSVDSALLTALIDVESGFEPRATSPKGAMGLMQLIPKTALQYGLIDPYDPTQNINAGTRYLKDLLAFHNGNIPLAIAAYNAGQGSVSRYQRRIPPYGETLLYVPRVLAKMKEYQLIFAEMSR